jgi:hypothetical protein
LRGGGFDKGYLVGYFLAWVFMTDETTSGVYLLRIFVGESDKNGYGMDSPGGMKEQGPCGQKKKEKGNERDPARRFPLDLVP